MNKVKLDQLRRIIKELDSEGLFITLQKNFSWVTAGRGFINLASEESVGKLFITKEAMYLIANNIEIDRLQEEELCQGYEIRSFPWYEPERLQTILNSLFVGNYSNKSDRIDTRIF